MSPVRPAVSPRACDMRSSSKPALAFAIAFALGGACPYAHALPARGTPDLSKEACADASEQGQELRDEGKLMSARERFVTCASEVCPDVIRKDCNDFLADVEKRLPSVVLSAKDAAGHDLGRVRVLVDGALLTENLDGKAIPLDPGQHLFRYEWENAPPYEERIVLLEGEKRRALTAVFKTPKTANETAPAQTAPAKRPLPILPFVLGFVGVAGGANFAILAQSAKSDYEDLKSSCAPKCLPDAVAPVKNKLIVANVSLGVSIGALGAAAVLFLIDASKPSSTTSPVAPSTTFGITPLPGGAAAFVGGPLPFN